MIEFQYFEGCPHSDVTLDGIKELIDEGIISIHDLKIVEVPNIPASESLNFQGSPTVLYNGIDIYTEKIPTSSNYCCRVYSIKGRQTGILNKDYIKMKLKKLQV
ncbi:MAG: alkylmercury lyase [Spirochaetaceae bacterium]